MSWVGVDKAQAAVLTYNFDVAGGAGSGSFKFSNSSLTGIGYEQLAVSEGRLNTYLTASFPDGNYQMKGKDYYDLVGATVLFYQGEFGGLQASGYDSASREVNISPDEPGGPYYIKYDGGASWNMANSGPSSLFWGYKEVTISNRNGILAIDRGGGSRVDYARVSYTLVDTVAEVPEPITVAGTALALAGLSWLKHQKKKVA
jgi:hypothetical protein